MSSMIANGLRKSIIKSFASPTGINYFRSLSTESRAKIDAVSPRSFLTDPLSGNIAVVSFETATHAGVFSALYLSPDFDQIRNS